MAVRPPAWLEGVQLHVDMPCGFSLCVADHRMEVFCETHCQRLSLQASVSEQPSGEACGAALQSTPLCLELTLDELSVGGGHQDLRLGLLELRSARLGFRLEDDGEALCGDLRSLLTLHTEPLVVR